MSLAARPARDPIDLLAQHHQRQRRMLRALERLAAAARPAPGCAAKLLAYLREDVPLHHRDEDEDLFALLRRRAEPEDDLADLLTRLSADHAASARRRPALIAPLARLAAGGAPFTAAERAALLAHAATERRHLIVENAIVLPLARARLSPADRRTLARSMAARRRTGHGARAAPAS